MFGHQLAANIFWAVFLFDLELRPHFSESVEPFLTTQTTGTGGIDWRPNGHNTTMEL